MEDGERRPRRYSGPCKGSGVRIAPSAGERGTEFAAQAQLFAKRALPRYPSLRTEHLRWLLVDLAPRVLPELGNHLGEVSLKLREERGIEIRFGVSVEAARERSVKLTDGAPWSRPWGSRSRRVASL